MVLLCLIVIIDMSGPTQVGIRHAASRFFKDVVHKQFGGQIFFIYCNIAVQKFVMGANMGSYWWMSHARLAIYSERSLMIL